MIRGFIVVIAILGSYVSSFHPSRIITRPRINAISQISGYRKLATSMSDTEPVVEESSSVSPASKSIKADFSSFAVGQEYEGKLMSAKTFGVFVDISAGYNVLIPRSVLSRSSFEKLKQMATDKSTELIKVELLGVSAENQTLSGKYISPKGGNGDLSKLSDVKSKSLNATVISAHDFGLFAEIDGYGVEGLIPASKLPEQMAPQAIKKAYTPGMKVVVKVMELNVEDKKLVLSMKVSSRPGVESFSEMPNTKWFQSIVQSVSPFGMFVRPAGFDSVGLVHASRVPRDLIAALKKKAPIAPGTNKTDVEALFSEGDVVRTRINSVDVTARRLELSMLPARSNEEEDDYIVPGRDPEGEEYKQDFQQTDDQEQFDAQATLLWWRGAPYEREADEDVETVDEEADVVFESKNVVEGTWRRMFEVDLRADENEFSSKVMEQELAELAEEIGELEGLDDELTDSLGFGVEYTGSSFGLHVSKSKMPESWGEQMEYFSLKDTADTTTMTGLKGGKKAEQAEFDRLLKEVEVELETASARPPAPAEPEPASTTDSLPQDVTDSSSAVSASSESEETQAVVEEVPATEEKGAEES